MSKLYRSLLWSGLVVAGVTACGDDLTITPAPPPTPTVHSVSVGPTATINVLQTLQMAAAVNADAGIATTVTWTTSNLNIASINATTGLVTGVAPGAVAITACSTVVTSVCGQATVTVSSAPVPTVTSVIVTPGNPVLPRTSPATTLQLFAAVVGTNSPPQTVTWQTSPNPAIATISATGLITVPTTSTGGTVVFNACSTLAGFTNVCGQSSLIVTIPTPAAVSYEGATWVPPAALPSCVPGPGPEVSINILNVACQIQVTANVNAGDQVLSRLDVLIGGTVVASQTFPGTVASDGTPQGVSGPIQVTLPVNTQQLRRPGATLFTPVIFNGNQAITLNLYVAGTAIPLASVATPIVMNNPDAALKIGAALTLVNNSSSPSFADGFGNTWFTGSQTAGAVNYIAFSNTAPTALPFGSTVCGASNSSTVTGTPTTGLSISSTFNCTTVEGGNVLTGVAFPATYAVATGPDGTPIIAAGSFSNIGTAFQMPINAAGTTESRWNMFQPGTAPTIPAAVFVDNKVPTVTLNTIAFNVLFDQQWINASYNLLTGVNAADGGTGVATKRAFFLAVGGGTCTSATIDVSAVAPGTAPLVETLTSDGTPEGHRICGNATDNIGNTSGKAGPSNFFGVDIVAPSVRLAGSTGATPLIAPSTVASVSVTPNTTIYGDAGGPLSGTLPVMPATDVWGLEGIDGRAGFNQNAVAGFPSQQSLGRLAVLGASSCVTFTSPLSTVLSDNFVRTPVLVALDCGLGIGYYAYSGKVVDRAGNASATIARNFARDHVAAPVLSSIGPSVPIYTAGSLANFFLFGTDDLEIIEGDITASYPNDKLVVATNEGFTYPLAAVSGAARWDALLNNIVTAGTIGITNFLGRVDYTCTGAGTPYAACVAVDNIVPLISAAQFDNVVGTDDGQSPDSVRAVVYDVASNASLSVVTGLLSIQTTDAPQRWAGQDLITWKILTPTGVSVIAEHKASTSITAPYFDDVQLGRANAGATEIRICGTFPAPVLTDNGVNRFWTYTITKPTGTAQCAAGGNWYAIGRKGATPATIDAALFTVGQP